MPIELKVPSVGESVSEIYIGRWYKSEGEAVNVDEGLVELESEKATLDVPAPAGGVVVKILKPSGATAEVGEVIALIDEHAEPAAKAAAPQASPAPPPSNGAEKPAASAKPAPPAAEGPPSPAEPARKRWVIQQEPPSPAAPAAKAAERPPQPPSESGPVVARPARREPESVAAAKPAAPPQPRQAEAPPVAGDRQEEAVPMSPVRRRIAARLVEAQHQAALLTTFNEVDMSAVKQLRAEFGESFQKRHGVKLGFMSFFVKAVVEALAESPELNAIIDDDRIVYRRYYDIGVAIGSDRGLVVPVLRNAERMSFGEIETAIEDLARRAQSGDLRVEELQGGTFTISNGGVYGSLLSTPIVNPPQSGVLGMHAIQDRPVAAGDQVVIRPMMYLALTYDHRIVDGRGAVTFLRRVRESIEQPARLLLNV